MLHDTGKSKTLLQDAYEKAVSGNKSKNPYKSNTPRHQAYERGAKEHARYVRAMSVEQFCGVRKHSRQRNTERHSKILLQSLKSKGDQGRIDEVAVAKFPNGNLEILNGHSRLHLWNNLLWPAPKQLKVTIYEVQTQLESDQLYESFDPSASRKDSRDDMESAANAASWEPKSSSFKNGRGAFTIKNAFAIFHGSRTHGLLTAEVHKAMLNEMMAIDPILAGHAAPHSFIIAGALVTYKKWGNKALEFLAKVMNNEVGSSNAPHQHVIKYALKIGGAGESAARDGVAFYIAAFRAFIRNVEPKEIKRVKLSGLADK